MAAIWAGVGSAVAGIAGDMIASGGQSAANTATANLNTENLQFQASEAAQNRAFQQSQVQAQERYQQNSINAAEAYSTKMSDTAMQRRVADLKASGLNPLLAVGQGGASTPQGYTAQGAAGSGSGVSGSTATMQNPDAAYANLGQVASSAATTASNVNLQQAQSTKALAEAKQAASATYNPGQFSAMIDKQMQNTVASAASTNQGVVNMQSQIKEIDAHVKQMEAQAQGQGISNQWAPLINMLATQTAALQKQLLQLQVPKAQVEAGVASKAQDVLGAAGGVTDSVGSYIGNKAADVHDWINDTMDKLGKWWNQAVQNSNSSNYR